MHFPLRWVASIGTVSFLVDFNEQPHSENVQDNMDVTHVVLVDVEVCEPIEKCVQVQGCRWVLDRTCFSNKLRVIIRFGHVNFSLLSVSIEINFMES